MAHTAKTEGELSRLKATADLLRLLDKAHKLASNLNAVRPTEHMAMAVRSIELAQAAVSAT